MNDVLLIDKQTMKPKNGIDISGAVGMTQRTIGGDLSGLSEGAAYDRAFAGSTKKKFVSTAFDLDKVSSFGGFMHTPVAWSDGSTMSAFERIASGKFGKSAQASTGNTLLPDWATLWDAMRFDITQQKNALPTIRENFYNITSRPDATKILKSNELYPYGVIFKDYTNSGAPVAQGDKRGGQVYTMEITIKAAGFMWDLLAKLFDETLDTSEMTRAVARGYNARLDNDAISPILTYGSYGNAGTAKHTAKATTSGAGRQELLYDTITNAMDGLSLRDDPIMKRKINVNGAIILASGYDARHIAQVASGLPSANQKYLPAISGLGGIVAYDGETIDLRDESATYAGVTAGTAYLIVPKTRYANIVTKAPLTVEIDMQPDVKTLAQQQYAWYYADVVDSKFVEYFVQKIELPTW